MRPQHTELDPKSFVGDKRALLAQIGHRQVRRVVAEDSPYQEALIAVVSERKAPGEGWGHAEWAAVLAELDASPLTVAQFLSLEHGRRAA